MISAIAWTPKGVAKAMPDYYEPSKEELEAMGEELEANGMDMASVLRRDDAGEEEEEDEEEETSSSSSRRNGSSSALAGGKGKSKNKGKGKALSVEDEFDMDNYDNESNALDTMGASIGDMLEALDPSEDPYITVPEDQLEDDEIEDVKIRKDECMILTARSEEDVSLLEVQVYMEDEAHMYVHHEVLLPEFPLCLAWLDYNASREHLGDEGNFVAIGTFTPDIEIWNLDLVDALEPVLVLEGFEGKARSKKAKKRGHTDAVMALSWNANKRNALASGSADTTVKVWDLEKAACLFTYTHHEDKVQCVQWHPEEDTYMATGSFDRTMAVLDAAKPSEVKTMELPADIEAMAWNPWDWDQLVASCEDGTVVCYDIRRNDKPLWTLDAHNKQCSSIGFSKCNRQPLMASGSTDGTVKLWDLTDNKPSLITSRDLGVGAVYCLDFSWDMPYVLSAGGQNGMLAVWDLTEQEEVEDVIRRLPEAE